MAEDKIPSFIRDNSFNMDRLPYAISFSFMPEYIPLWAMYANNGKGVCLCFNLNEIIESEGLSFVPIIYNYDSIPDDYKILLRNTIYSELLNFRARIETISDPKKILFEKFSCIRVLSTVLSPYFKHPSFEFENELRLIKYCDRENVEFRRKKDSIIIPYVKIKIPLTSLKEVVVGPCSDYKFNSNIINTYLKYADSQHIVKINPSKVPYRLL